MEVYDENLTIKEGLSQLFHRFNLSDDSYTAKWFTIGIGQWNVYLPNIPSRVRVAKLHDIHHVLTGYPPIWRGEAEIGAWELATGCRGYFVAWFLNGGAVLVGLFLFPRAVWKAFIRGWRSKSNLYYIGNYELLLNMTVKELRQTIGLDMSFQSA